MKLKNKIFAGVLGLAGLVGGALPAQAHNTIKHENEYKIVLGPGMSTWKALEYVQFGKLEGSKRPTKEQRVVSKSLVGCYEHTLFDHELPEIDQHIYKSPEWKEHMRRIKRMRSDHTGYGDVKYLDWVKRTKRMKKSDGLAMELRPGDYFWMPERLIENPELMEKLDKKDGRDDNVIIADGTPVKVPKKKAIEEVVVEEEPKLEPLPSKRESKAVITGTAGYMNEQLDGETFLDGPKFDVDFTYSTGISDNWDFTLKMENEILEGTFYDGEGTATAFDSEVAGMFDYRINDNFAVGIGPRADILKADIDYAGNEASLMDVTAGVAGRLKLDTEHFNAIAAYSRSLGTGGDSMQGHNPISKDKVELEARVNVDPVHLNLVYEYEHDQQNIRGVDRSNSEHTIEASADYDVTKNVSVTAGYERKMHEGDANSTTSDTIKGGVKFHW